MGVVREYMKRGGGNWAKASNVAVGATVTIGSVYEDSESFENQSYIVINGIYDPTGEEIKVRLGIQNLTRVVEALGEDEAQWTGNKLSVLGFQDYPGLGKKGVLWGAMRLPQQSRI